jgi:hypothetical protein
MSGDFRDRFDTPWPNKHVDPPEDQPMTDGTEDEPCEYDRYTWTDASAIDQIANGTDDEKAKSAGLYLDGRIDSAMGSTGADIARRLFTVLWRKREQPQEVCIALQDRNPFEDGRFPFVVGAFSNQDKARGACQADVDETAEIEGYPPPSLTWEHGEAASPLTGDYAVVTVQMDARNS